jgi:short-subunit dehydrogenase
MTNVSGKVLVTGATGGIGHAIARAFAARGATLTLTGRRADVLEPLAAEVSGRAVACDLADRAAVERLIDDVGDVDIFVSNAALPASGHLTELSQAQIDNMLEVNLHAPVAMARALAPAMVARRSGHMVFISSLAGKAASGHSSLYSATKFGLRGFALGIREDLRPAGVGVSVVTPGFISGAGMFADTKLETPAGVGTRTPEQVAHAVITCIERNRAEMDVAPVALRLGTAFAQIAPGFAAKVSRKLGGEKMAADMSAAQLDKRP